MSTPISSNLNHKQAVLATLAYFELFDYPLKSEEVTRYLYRLKPDAHAVDVTLNESRILLIRGSYFQIDSKENLVEKRHDRELIAKRFWKRVHRFRWIFQITPFMELTAVCNNLALSNTNATSDIDLLILTKPERLFTARLWITGWLHLLGVRRHGKKIAGRFCLSFFAANGALNMEEIQKGNHDIYLAYWLQTLQPIGGNRDVYENLLEDNAPWLKRFFYEKPLYNMHHFKENTPQGRRIKRGLEKMLSGKMGEHLEKKLREWQLKRSHAKQKSLNVGDTDVIVTEKILKFHNTDRRDEIYERWVKRLKEILT